MSQRIIQPSASDQQFPGKSDGYEYTVGPKQAITSEASTTYIPSRIYSEALGRELGDTEALKFSSSNRRIPILWP